MSLVGTAGSKEDFPYQATLPSTVQRGCPLTIPAIKRYDDKHARARARASNRIGYRGRIINPA